MRPWQFVGSSLVAERWKVSAWGKLRRVWGCLPWKESNQDGLGEEIDVASLFLVKNRANRN